MLIQTGVTPEGKRVVSGVYRCFETIGVPLDVLFSILADRDAIPDWLSFYDEALKAGMKRDRILAKLEEAISDAYGADFRDQVMLRLKRFR
jgi:hypothetical protein